MISRPRGSLHKGILLVAFLAVGGASIWVFQNRETLAAACLNTINGVTSKMAHLSQPFGVGASVQPKNPILGVVPDFSFTERSGRSVKKSDLFGSYWIASFIFTRCATSCPMTVTELARLQTDLPEEVRLVSFSVDPEHDTPAILADYAKTLGADLDRWLFLTGDKSETYRYIREGFHLTVQENSGASPGWQVTHSPRFALVDPKGRIRGYYESSDAEDLARLRKDVRRLVRRDGEKS
ncbi:MAG: SCO family protein [Candidatus Krumholzibacteria bacterium]